ncbi:MAG: hypothetical protein J1E41_04950, partial [Ruminococcus sp.]|nr:hypothetical protein [Ruminococcus sp.]
YELKKCDFIDLNSSVGYTCAEYVWIYPPGSPIIVPGEVISEEIIAFIKSSFKNNLDIQSTYNKFKEKIYCEIL